jgi:hypothetical protein
VNQLPLFLTKPAVRMLLAAELRASHEYVAVA